jgi:hypothetical protein
MPTPVATLQTANPSMGTVSRQPQTTGQAASAGQAPFTRLSRQGQILGPAQAGQAYSSLWTPILKPVGGYLRQLVLTVTSVTGGALTGAAVQADAPYNVIQNLFLRDPFGQPVIQAGGYSLYLINVYGGQYGMLGFGNNLSTMPSYTAPNAATGAFQFRMNIPLEMDSSGYGSLPSMNAASQPQLQIQWNPSTTVFGAHTGTDPTLTTSANETFWMAPVDHPEIAPPDVGSSGQWSEARAAAGVASQQFQRIQLPRVGTFIHTLILRLIDSTGVRVEAWPTSDLTLWVDGVPVLFEALLDRRDKMFAQAGVTAPTGVINYSFRDSVQTAVSTADTYDLLLPTTPATLLEVSGTFGTITNAPATILAVTGELFPVGGIPYNHLAS